MSCGALGFGQRNMGEVIDMSEFYFPEQYANANVSELAQAVIEHCGGLELDVVLQHIKQWLIDNGCHKVQVVVFANGKADVFDVYTEGWRRFELPIVKNYDFVAETWIGKPLPNGFSVVPITDYGLTLVDSGCPSYNRMLLEHSFPNYTVVKDEWLQPCGSQGIAYHEDDDGEWVETCQGRFPAICYGMTRSEAVATFFSAYRDYAE